MKQAKPSIELAEYRWRNRLLLLVAPDQSHPVYLEQRRLLDEREPDLQERDLLVFDIFQDAGRVGRQELSARSIARIRERFDLPPGGFELVLIGKDGTAKRRESSPVSAETLFVQIDGMPMRIRELRGG